MRSYPVVIASTIIWGVSSAVILPLSDTLIANSLVEADRSKAMSIYLVLLLGLTSLFGWIGGILSEISPRLPFILMAVASTTAAAIALAISRLETKSAGAESTGI